MVARIVKKELLDRLLDLRFVAVFALCAALSALSVYAGGRSYARQVQEYDAVSDQNRRTFKETSLEKGRLYDVRWIGYKWNRRPEVLTPLVFGLSGVLGREVWVSYQRGPLFEASVFESDPIHLLFEGLDLAFIVKVVLSLSILLFTYDVICGEKEGGTLRLQTSFPVSRATLALSKLIGSTVAALVPFVFTYLLAVAALVLSPRVALTGEDWGRIASLMGIFALYLVVFAAFGLLVSALCHRRLTAFLILLGLWTGWLFVVPNLALDLAGHIAPVDSIYSALREEAALDAEVKRGALAEMDEYEEQNQVQDWGALSEAQRQRIFQDWRETRHRVDTKWDAEYLSRTRARLAERRNQMRRQARLAAALAAVSPTGATTFVSADLARNGSLQQEQVETALNAYLLSLGGYVRSKQREARGSTLDGVDLTDFSWFAFRDTDTLAACLTRNRLYILNLALLAILGFAGAYVAILRYDVR